MKKPHAPQGIRGPALPVSNGNYSPASQRADQNSTTLGSRAATRARFTSDPVTGADVAQQSYRTTWRAHMSAETREDGLAALDAGLQAGDEAPLSVDESRLLTQWAGEGKEAPMPRPTCGVCCIRDRCCRRAVNLALRWLEEIATGTSRAGRWRTCGRHRPDLMPRLAEQFSRDSDAGVRYELAQFWLPTRPDEAVDLMIDGPRRGRP